ncbi:MAG: 2-amino-4-hydroxy-6-hydroxymethyldihydropteridine diphosphokinase, partial [Oligoflexia bacterium]|nr:2-amino-4-hydroxy-6-hydroxymethyldihydropteridine diphosphokinase [Oligoflexia bacterium]
MSFCFLSLGSNMGDREYFLEQARNELESLEMLKITGKSPVMETSPVGFEGQAFYLNQVLLAETSIEPAALLAQAKDIEKKIGRIDRSRWAEREIDIDIILYEGVLISTPELTIPHKELASRLFLLEGCR